MAYSSSSCVTFLVFVLTGIRYLAAMEPTVTESGDFFAVNVAIILMFFALAAFAGLLVLLYGRIVYKRWFSWLRLFGGALLGGFLAGVVIWFASEFEAVRKEDSLESFNNLLVMISWILLPLMLLIPIVSIMLRNRSAKIAQLELEVNALKTQLAAKPSSSNTSTTPPVI
jgi:hypothetical protein